MAYARRLPRVALWALAAILVLYVGLLCMRTLWPIDFAEAVRSAAAEEDLEADLVFALIYAESRFDPEAVSPRGAIGLMQISPSTGRWIAEQLNLPEPAREDLYDIERNLRFGTWYLRRLLDRFGDVETALEAYNAGPTTVEEWLDDGETPYRETIEYVRRIQGARPVYRVYMRIPALLRIVPPVSL